MTRLDPDLRALQEVRDCVERARAAQAVLARCSQAEIDRLCEAVAKAGAAAAVEVSRLAVDETGIGRFHYKLLKTLFGTEATWASIKNEKTVGIVSRDERSALVEVATPVGVVACIVPTTNPTSTAFNKVLITLKGRNASVVSPHPRARRTIARCVEIARQAIERAGGPPEAVQVLTNPTIESTGALMKHPGVDLILATGGTGLVKAAYSSGKPAYGVGPGNVPCYVDRSADIEDAARWIIASQSFDNGTFCCSEQGLVVDRPIHERLIAAMKKRGAHVCNEEETKKLERYCNRRGHMNPDVVGLDPHKVAEAAGFQVPASTTLLLAYQGGVGPEYPLSIEILCPILSVHVVDGWEEGCEVSLATLRSDGLGHTIALWARDERVIEAWMLEKPANRIIVNGPSSEGAVGYSTNLPVSVSLGCGPMAGNITSDNITAKHMVNLKRVAFRRADWEAQYERDHARAARLSGDPAPRGSGFQGDPGLRRADGSPAPTAPLASNWTGNPAVWPRPGAPADAPRAPSAASSPAASRPGASGPATSTLATKVAPAAKSAPRFTDAAVTRVTSAPSPAPFRPTQAVASPAPAAAPHAAAPSASKSGPFVGLALSTSEIQGILAHAGSGCPLGPCKGCPHHDVQSGACTA